MKTWDAIRRRNLRQYSGQPIARENLERILKAGRRAPFSGNWQPWNFVVVTDREQLIELAKVWDRGGRHLKRRFNRDFWVKDRGYFAIALGADGRQVDSLASDIGHLLWSGIVEKSKTTTIVRHLMSAQLFSGWGVRTLAEGEGRYNPIGYHVGTVWPFDNSFIAWGLRKYGFKEEAARVAEGILGAAQFFGGCLPEAFGGYPRQMTKYPVQYPTACSPQAWATGAPLLLLRAVLGWSPWGTTSWSIRRCQSAWAGWSSSTSRGDGAGSTRSDAAASTRHARIPLRG
jgi:glycogen debranching enzyme